MPNARALVGNASDPEQVKKGKDKEKYVREKEGHDLRAVLMLPAGRRVLSRMLATCRIDESSFDQQNSRMSYFVGRQDIGREWKAAILAESKEAWILMQQEALELIESQDEPSQENADA